MKAVDLTKQFCGNSVLSFKQNTIDIAETIEETLDNDDMSLSDRVGACQYVVDTALEVYDKSLPDYEYLRELSGALETVTE